MGVERHCAVQCAPRYTHSSDFRDLIFFFTQKANVVMRLQQFLLVPFAIYTDRTVEWNNDTRAAVQV